MSKFIILEGPDGVGKSTVAMELGKLFTEHGNKVVVTREPGGTTYAERIRELLLFPGVSSEMALDETRMMLAFAARKQHVEYLIKPSLGLGKVVVCDRFEGSTYVLQKAYKHQNLFEALLENVYEGLPTPFYVLLEASHSTVMARKDERDIDGGIIEAEHANSHDADLKYFKEYMSKQENYLCVGCDDLTPSQIAQEIFDYVNKC